MTIRDREEAALADLRARHPDRRAYIHPIHGVPVVGPTLDELHEVADILGEDEKEERKQLHDPKYVLGFIRECNGEGHGAKARDLSLGKRVKSVEKVVAVAARVRMNDSSTDVIARIRTADGKKKLVHASLGYSSGDFYEPPSQEGEVNKLTEEGLAKLLSTGGYEEVL